MVIDLIIISKDRPLQLRALLESLNKNADGLFNTQVNYTFSCHEFESGYKKLKKESTFKDVFWRKEENLKQDYITAVKSCKSQVVCMATDDCIFYRKADFKATDIRELFDERTCCFSFRYGLNTVVQDYRTGTLQPQLVGWECPEINGVVDGRFIRWDWTQYNPFINHAYWMGQDFHCFLVGDWLSLIQHPDVDWGSFRDLESKLVYNRRIMGHKPHISSPRESCVVNIPANESQGGLYCSKKIGVSLQELNQRYLDGETIDVDAMDFSLVVGAHQEIPLRFKSA